MLTNVATAAQSTKPMRCSVECATCVLMGVRRRTSPAGVVVEGAEQADDAARVRVRPMAVDCDEGLRPPVRCARHLVRRPPGAINMPGVRVEHHRATCNLHPV